jgi:hypothetical protein
MGFGVAVWGCRAAHERAMKSEVSMHTVSRFAVRVAGFTGVGARRCRI